MTSRSRIIGICSVFLGLVAMSAIAGPPFPSNNSRTFGNEVVADVCTGNPDLQVQRCAHVNVSEQYDNKGTYEVTNFLVSYSFYRPTPNGGWRTGWRDMFCQYGEKMIDAKSNRVTLDAVLHPEGPECSTYGYIEDCDEFWNCTYTDWGFPEPTILTGEWLEPMNTSKVMANRTDSFFYPWTETSYKVVNHCNERNGDTMSQGGFTLDLGSRVHHFPFEGFDTQGWSGYWLRSCNDNFKAK